MSIWCGNLQSTTGMCRTTAASHCLRGYTYLEAVAVFVIEGVCSCPKDERLAVQHMVLPHHDLHEGLAPTKVQEGPPATMQSSCLLLVSPFARLQFDKKGRMQSAGQGLRQEIV